MKIYRTDQYPLWLPPGHRFPARKYAVLYDAVSAFAAHLFEDAPLASDAELAHVHTAAYIEAVTHGTLSKAEQQQIGLPWSPELPQRSRGSVGATLAACRSALVSGCGASLAGGTHHAYADHGSGFCVFNDSAVALKVLLAEGVVRRAMVIDLDVHQGNGTAKLLADEPCLFTLSIHGAHNFPFTKEHSDLDIELEDGCQDEHYLDVLESTLPGLLGAHHPDLVIYLAGADAYAGDRLGRLGLTKAGMAQRDHLVMDWCDRFGVPMAITMGGGYATPIEDTVAIHAATLAEAVRRYGHAHHIGD
ncbi:histone deacetylase family protein [Amantichitinum ursilacus]|uniref:Acetoin utilization protein AcuC n=1 Tax=Amantichitinum ursilacus TaxID=857265 RepID=A0A0N0GQW3_9NEIS|nr:histone deacetylase [Amantichitinum ursilacus]KPC55260.1 Acetoin utilization protein AcuC [Amantichitinum ursilacus]